MIPRDLAERGQKAGDHKGAGDDTMRDLMAAKERRFRELIENRVEIFPGVRELLDELRAEPRIATAIGSGALRTEILSEFPPGL